MVLLRGGGNFEVGPNWRYSGYWGLPLRGIVGPQSLPVSLLLTDLEVSDFALIHAPSVMCQNTPKATGPTNNGLKPPKQ
jgi:hypothetical protein